MINKKYRKIFLFTVLLILLIGVASAANVDKDTTANDNTQTVTDTVDDNNHNSHTESTVEKENEIKKQNVEERTTKTSNESYTEIGYGEVQSNMQYDKNHFDSLMYNDNITVTNSKVTGDFGEITDSVFDNVSFENITTYNRHYTNLLFNNSFFANSRIIYHWSSDVDEGQFTNVTFINTTFKNMVFDATDEYYQFKDCQFTNTTFINSKLNIHFKDTQFDNTLFNHTKFEIDYETQFVTEEYLQSVFGATFTNTELVCNYDDDYTVQVNVLNDLQYVGDTQTVTGSLFKNSQALTNTDITLELAYGDSYFGDYSGYESGRIYLTSLSTDENGEFMYDFTLSEEQSSDLSEMYSKIVVSYYDDYEVRQSEYSSSFSVKSNYNFDAQLDTSETSIGNSIEISGNLNRRQVPLTDTTIYFSIYEESKGWYELGDEPIYSYVLFDQVSTQTDESGNYRLDYLITDNMTGVYRIDVSYTNEENELFNRSLSFVVRNYNITLDVKDSAYIDENLTVSGKLTKKSIPVSNEMVNINIIDTNQGYEQLIEILTVTTDENGEYSIDYTIPSDFTGNYAFKAVYNEQFKHMNNVLDSNEFSARSTVNIKYYEISLNPITETFNSGDTILISGNLTRKQEKVSDKTVKIEIFKGQVNWWEEDELIFIEENVPVNNGQFSINYTIPENLDGYYYIKASFVDENERSYTNKTTLKRIPTSTRVYYYHSILYVNEELDFSIGVEPVEIENYVVFVKINEELIPIDIYGYEGYYKFSPDSTGIKNLTFIYPGNEMYLPSNASATINVTIPLTRLSLYMPSIVKQNEIITIYGDLEYMIHEGSWSESRSFPDQSVVLTVNGEEFYLTTDEYGRFSMEYTATSFGINNVTVSYDGKDVYQSDSVNETFIVSDKEKTSIFLDIIYDVQYGSEIIINGFVENWLENQTILINVNGENYTTTTTSDGHYSLSYKTETIGINNVTVSLVSEDYVAEDNMQSFEVNKHNMRVESSVTPGSDSNTLKITYKLYDENNQAVSGASVIINGETNLTTDSNGEAIYVYAKDSGVNEVRFEYEGDEYHNYVSNYLSFDDNKINTVLQVSYGRLSYDSASGQYVKPIAVSLFDSNGNPLINQSINVIIDGDEQTVTTDVTGQYIINYTTAVLGTKNIAISYNGNEVYSSSDSIDESFEIAKSTIDFIEYDLYESAYRIIINVYNGYDTEGYRVNVDTINIKINEEDFNVSANENGFVSYVYTVPKSGNYTVTITTLNEAYYPWVITQTFEMKSIDAIIELNDVNVDVYTTVYIGGRVYYIDEYDNERMLAEVPLSLMINGELVNDNITTDSSGYFTYHYTPNASGTDNITVILDYGPYNKVNASTTVDITLPQPSITLYVPSTVKQNENIEIYGALGIIIYIDEWDDDEILLINENVVLTVNGEEFNLTTDEYGRFSMEYTATSIGTNNVTVYYNKEGVYEPVSSHKTFKVTTTKDETILNLNYIEDVKYGSEISIKGCVDNYLNNQTIIININGESFTATTTNDGEYSMSYKTNIIGINTVTVSLVSDEYTADDCYQSFEVLKLDTRVLSSFTQESDNNTLKITYKLLDENGLVVPNASVIINGETTLTTDSNGEAIYVYAKDSGVNEVRFNYKGDEYHNYVSNYLTFDDNKIHTGLYIYDGNLSYNSTSGQYKKQIIAVLFDSNGNRLFNQSMKVIIDGDEQIITTDYDGQGTINYSTSVLGEINLFIIYEGNDGYLSSSYNNTIEVEKTAISSVLITTIKNGNVIHFDDISGIDEKGNIFNYEKMNLNINGEDINISAQEDGLLSYDYIITKPGNYTITVTPLSEIYKSFTITNTYEINKVKPYLGLWGINTVEFRSEAVIECSVSYYEEDHGFNNLAGIPIILMINGNLINDNITTDLNGYYSYHYLTNTVGINNVSVMIKNNELCSDSESDTTFEVYKGSFLTFISINPIENVHYGNNVTITGRLTDEYGDALQNSEILILIGEDEIYTSTDSEGYYKYEFTATEVNSFEVHVTFNGISGYYSSENETTFTVTKKDTKITINPIDTTFVGDIVIISGQVADIDDKILSDVNIMLSVNGNNYTVTTNANGEFTKTFVSDKVGTNNVVLSFEGNGTYNSANATSTFTVNKKSANVTLNSISSSVYGNDVVISGKLTDNNNAISGASVKVTVNGKDYTATTNSNGEFTTTVTAKTVGNNVVTVSYAGSSIYNSANASGTLTVTKKNTKLTVDSIASTVYNNKVTVTGKLSDADNKALNGVSVKVTVNDKDYTVNTNSNGVYTQSVTADNVGSNSVTVSYVGSTIYNSASDATTFTVTKKNTLVTLDSVDDTVYDSNVTVTGKISDVDGKALSNVKVVLTVGGVSSTVNTGTTGEFSYVYLADNVGTITVTAKFNGDTNYNANNASTGFAVSKRNTKLTVNKVTATVYGSKVTVTGKLTDNNSKVISGTSVLIKLNNDEYTVKTNDNGVYTYTTTKTTAGKNNVNALYNGDKSYGSSSASTSFTLKEQTKLTANSIANADNGTTIKISGKLLSNNKAFSGATVTVNVDGKKYSAKTSSTGYFTVNYKVTSIKTHKVTFSYAGDATHFVNTTQTSFKVKSLTSFTVNKISVQKYGATVKVSGKLLSDGKAVKSQSITVKVNGKAYTAKTSSSGYFSISHKADKYGTNQVTYTFAGTNTYSKSSATGTFSVLHDTKISFYKITNKLINNTIKVNGKLLSDGKAVKKANITITVNGVKYTAKTSGSGYFAITYKVDNYDKQKITYSFDGNSLYGASKDSTYFYIKKPTTLTAYNVKTVKKGATVKVSGKLLTINNAGARNQTVNVNVNGQPYTAKTAKNGYFTVSVKTSAVGTNNVTYSFKGSGLYLKCDSVSSTFKVKA